MCVCWCECRPRDLRSEWGVDGSQALPTWGQRVTNGHLSTRSWAPRGADRSLPPAPPDPLPWSRLSPPGSPGASMARRCHPHRYRSSLRGPQAACWPCESVRTGRPLCAHAPCPININELSAARVAAAAGTAPPAGAPPALTLHCHCHGQAGKHTGWDGAPQAGVGVGVGMRETLLQQRLWAPPLGCP